MESIAKVAMTSEGLASSESIRRPDEIISEALVVLDKGLGDIRHRELISTNEIADLLLDVRQLLVNPALSGTTPNLVEHL